MSAPDLLRADDVVHADLDRMARLRFIFVDHSRAAGLSASTDGIRELARRGKKDHEIVGPDLGVIAIAAPNLVLYGMTRMWMFLSETPYCCDVFRSRDQTLTWLAENVRERSGNELDLSDPAFGADLHEEAGVRESP